MQAGRLDRRITIERLGPPVDTGFTDRSDFEPLTTRSAELVPLRGAEMMAAGENAAFTSAKFRIRRPRSIDPMINPMDRLKYGGRTYDIVGVDEIGRDTIEIMATARAEPEADADPN